MKLAWLRQLPSALRSLVRVHGGSFVFWRVVEVLVGLFSIKTGLFDKEFTPVGWTTMLIWGRGTRIPRWIAGTFYVALGLVLLFIGVRGR